jgi:hypothetical protein
MQGSRILGHPDWMLDRVSHEFSCETRMGFEHELYLSRLIRMVADGEGMALQNAAGRYRDENMLISLPRSSDVPNGH